MNDSELKAAFPYGARVMPRAEDEVSYTGVLGKPNGDDTFSIWDSPYHETTFNNDITAQDDGFIATNTDGAKYFLRPLTEDQEVSF